MTSPEMKEAFRKLRAIIDGASVEIISRPDAMTIHAELWDSRQRLGNLSMQIAAARKREEQLQEENAKLVGQIVAEEARANFNDRELADARAAILRLQMTLESIRHDVTENVVVPAAHKALLAGVKKKCDAALASIKEVTS